MGRQQQQERGHEGAWQVVSKLNSWATSGWYVRPGLGFQHHHGGRRSPPPSHCSLARASSQRSKSKGDCLSSLPVSSRHLCFLPTLRSHLHAAMSGRRRTPGPKKAAAITKPSCITVTVKTLKKKERFEVAESSTIQDFKAEIAPRFQAPAELLVLIFAGKILKDQDTLSQHSVHSGASVHLVIRAQKRPPDSPAEYPHAPTITGLFANGGASSLLSPGGATDLPHLGLTHAPELQSQLEHVVASSQAFVAQIMENLLFEIVHTDLDLNTINSSPFLMGFLIGVTGLSLLGLDPMEVSELLSEAQDQDAFISDLVGEMVQSPLANPDLVRELLLEDQRVQQLAERTPLIGHLLSSPSFLREILDAASHPATLQEMVRSNDRALSNLESLPGGYSTLQQLYHDVEEPMLEAEQAPFESDPFAPQQGQPPSGGVSVPARTENRHPLPNPWDPQSLQAGEAGNGGESEHTGHNLVVLNLGPAAGAGVPRAGGIQGMVQQLTDNQELMQNLGSALANPNGPAQRMLRSDPLSCTDGSPRPLEEMQLLPQQLEHTDISAVLTNPRAVPAFLQVLLGLHTLLVEAPDFIQGLGQRGMEPQQESMDSSTRSSMSEEDVSFSSERDESDSPESMDEQTPEVRFEHQMAQLSTMGFQDHEANLQALIDTEGEIDAAIEMLTKPQPPSKIL
ncbi:ubiquilin-1-like [Alligator mississippiensis]|nr:ubiquilin-1-like [Alligator mississippiensis]